MNRSIFIVVILVFPTFVFPCLPNVFFFFLILRNLRVDDSPVVIVDATLDFLAVGSAAVVVVARSLAEKGLSSTSFNLRVPSGEVVCRRVFVLFLLGQTLVLVAQIHTLRNLFFHRCWPLVLGLVCCAAVISASLAAGLLLYPQRR